MIGVFANYSGSSQYDRVVYGSKIEKLYVKIKKENVLLKEEERENIIEANDILEIKENLEVTSELINVQIKLNKIKEENEDLIKKIDKLNMDMEDLVGFIKKEIKK
jgi:hypothetical protein